MDKPTLVEPLVMYMPVEDQPSGYSDATPIVWAEYHPRGWRVKQSIRGGEAITHCTTVSRRKARRVALALAESLGVF